MPAKRKTKSKRALKLDELKVQLAEAVETLEAIRSGAVDALVVHGPRGEQVFTLKGADQVYRAIVETMNEGAVSINPDQTVLYCNQRFAEIVQMPLEKIAGVPFTSFTPPNQREKLAGFLKKSLKERGTHESVLLTSAKSEVAVQISANPVAIDGEVGISLVVTDITERKQFENARRDLAIQILTAQEQERYRVSRELHDGINQLLSSVHHRFSAIASSLKRGRTQNVIEDLGKTSRLLEDTIEAVRRISRNLRPSELDDLGLVPALQMLMNDFQNRNDLGIKFTNQLKDVTLEKHRELAIYRIVQEAFNNIERHARAARIEFSLALKKGSLNVLIRDDGRGFDAGHPEQRGFGLVNMKERAAHAGGSLQCKSAPGRGTEISLNIPL